MSSEFLDILFDHNDQVCMGQDVYSTRVGAADSFGRNNFVSINALTKSRKDDNVTCFRNILCEFDKGTLEEQLKSIKESGLPFSTIVFSGNKSYHAIVSLDKPLDTREQYDRLVKFIYDKLPGVDPTGRNPSRFTRMPGVWRDGKQQELIEYNGRVPNEVVYNWLDITRESLEFIPLKEKHYLLGGKLIPSRTDSFFKYGAPEGCWNIKLFESACEMSRAGFSQEETEERAFGINGYLTKSDKRTIKSAYDTTRREG